MCLSSKGKNRAQLKVVFLPWHLTTCFPEQKLFILREQLADSSGEDPVCRESAFPRVALGEHCKASHLRGCTPPFSSTEPAPQSAPVAGLVHVLTPLLSEPQLRALLTLSVLRSNLFRALSMLPPTPFKKDLWFHGETVVKTLESSCAFSYRTGNALAGSNTILDS